MKLNLLIFAVFVAFGMGLTYWLGAGGVKTVEKSAQIEKSLAAQQQANSSAPQAGQMPAFSFTALDGAQIHTNDLKGKILIVNFWATWCPPCVKEFPLLLETAKAYDRDVVLIALSSDFKDDALMRFVGKMRAEYPDAMRGDNVLIAKDENQAITNGIFNTFKLPETVITDQNHNMVNKFIGADWDMDDMKSVLAQVLHN